MNICKITIADELNSGGVWHDMLHHTQAKHKAPAKQCIVCYTKVSHTDQQCWETQADGSLAGKKKGWNECAVLSRDFSLLITKEIITTPGGEPR